LAGAAGSVILIGGYLYWEEHRTVAPPEPERLLPPPGLSHMLRGGVARVAQGIYRPPTLSASQAQLADGEEVVGVAVAGRHRAYALSAFQYPLQQVVNDLVGDVPVTVTYCIQGKRPRVFTTNTRGSPLSVTLAPGREARDILLGIGGDFYSQRSLQPFPEGAVPFPLRELKVSRTSWKPWKELHPDTDVCVGLTESWRRNPPPPLEKGQ
jgi:hypothetical protein